MSGRAQRSKQTEAASPGRAPLGVRPPSFVAAEPGRREQALVALRALYRDRLESLDSGAETSVDPDDQQTSARSD
jgi:hypothetical protein